MEPDRTVRARPKATRDAGEDNRLFVNGVLWIARTGTPWRDLPERLAGGIRSFNDSIVGAKAAFGSGFKGPAFMS